MRMRSGLVVLLGTAALAGVASWRRSRSNEPGVEQRTRARLRAPAAATPAHDFKVGS